MSELLKRADAFAEAKHRGQTDKAGRPYIEHPRAVAEKLDGEIEKIVALLHDTVEDTDATIEEIRSLFGNEVAEAIGYLTHDKSVPYMDYIEHVKGNDIARKVKLADLSHNMDLSRLPVVTEKDRERVEKYKKARAFLEG